MNSVAWRVGTTILGRHARAWREHPRLAFGFSVEATIACGRAKAWILAPSARMTILDDRSGVKDRDQSPIHDQPDSTGPSPAMTAEGVARDHARCWPPYLMFSPC